MGLFVGIDGGGSHTRAFALDAAAERGAMRVGEASNPNGVGWERTCERIVALVRAALAELGRAPGEVTALCAAVAGISGPRAAARLHELLREALPGPRIEATNDALAALTAGTRGRPGIVLVAGTGTIAVGEDAHGRTVRAGGMGYLLGDEGSGFEIGRRGLRAAVQAHERRGPPTALWEAARAAFGIAEPGELLPLVYGAPHPVAAIASFARAVVEAAPCDDVAARIVEEAIDQHARLIASVYERLTFDEAPAVVLAGGLYAPPAPWMERVQQRLPALRCVTLTYSAAAGAVLRTMLADAESTTLNESGHSRRAATLELWERVVKEVEGQLATQGRHERHGDAPS